MNRNKRSLCKVTLPLFMLLLLMTACTPSMSSSNIQAVPTTTSAFSLRCPHQVALDKQGNIYVTEDATHSADVRIVKLSSTGQVLAMWHPLKSGLTTPQGIALSNVTFDAQGNVYFTENAENSVMKFSPQGAFLAQFGTSKQTSHPLQFPTRHGYQRTRQSLCVGCWVHSHTFIQMETRLRHGMKHKTSV